MSSGPLDHPLLLEIEAHLDRAEIDTAQRLLAELGELPVHRAAITYFATRLLYQRGRLDAAGVVERLRDLLHTEPDFPQARAMLSAAELGTLQPDRDGFLRATLDPGTERSRADLTTRPPLERRRHAKESSAPSIDVKPDELDTEHEQLVLEEPQKLVLEPERRADPRRSLSMPEIPRAPMLPRFTTPINLAPSYAPGVRSASLQFELELEPPSAPRDTIRQNESVGPPPSENEVEGPPTERDPTSAPPSPVTHPPSTIPIAHPRGPESVLDYARALWARGVREPALDHVQRLEQAPLLDPELRAECARFLIEAGEPERAVQQARRALSEDPRAPLAQLTLVWALVRAARRVPNRETIDEAESVLLRVHAKPGALPGNLGPAGMGALSQALRAAILAENGPPERAISTAQLALKSDPTALDAEAAMSLAYARLGRMDEARAAWQRLFELAPQEAERLFDRLQQLGVGLRDLRAAKAGREILGQQLWDNVEVALFGGDQQAAISAFEHRAAQDLLGLVGESATGAIPLLATMAAAFFTTEPVWRHFGPFDLSLGSIARVEAVLDLLYGRAPRAALPSTAYPAQVMLASYVGESLRQGYGGKWLGSLAEPETVFVDSGDTRFAPFRELRLRLSQGKPLSFAHARGKDPRVSGAPIAMPVAPPTPWDPAGWPSPRMLPELGVAFSQSVVALYCAEFGGGLLARSPADLHCLDRYVALIAPTNARLTRGARWVERAAVLIGAYLGEVLRVSVGAAWREGASEPVGPESYTLVLTNASTTQPIREAYDRLSGGHTRQLSRYVARLIDELG